MQSAADTPRPVASALGPAIEEAAGDAAGRAAAPAATRAPGSPATDLPDAVAVLGTKAGGIAALRTDADVASADDAALGATEVDAASVLGDGKETRPARAGATDDPDFAPPAVLDRAKRPPLSSDRAAQDPLARLLREADFRTARSDAPTSVVAGRLAEVESSIARSRVESALAGDVVADGPDAGGTARAPDDGAPRSASAPTPGGVGSTGIPSSGATADAAAAARAASTAATVSTIAADAPTSGLAGPAADLAASAAADDASVSPSAARLAAKGMELLASQRGGSITMRLEPPALGQLRIQLQVSQGAVVADFTAVTAEARMLLEANLGMLRERLESQGLSVERLTVHGGRGTDTAVAPQSSQQGDARQDGTDARDRGDRGAGQGRQDAADGESRGRRDGEPRREERDGAGARMRGGSERDRRGFASVLAGTAEARRAG